MKKGERKGLPPTKPRKLTFFKKKINKEKKTQKQ